MILSSPDEPFVRHAIPADIPALAPLVVASFDTPLPDVILPTDPDWALDKVRELLAARLFPSSPEELSSSTDPPSSPKDKPRNEPNARASVLATASGDMLGYAVVMPPTPHPATPSSTPPSAAHPTRPSTPPGAELIMLFVRADRCGRGYGGQLMAHVQHEWAGAGLWLKVFARNERAWGFCRKWGFEEVGEEEVEVPVGEGAERSEWRRERLLVIQWKGPEGARAREDA